DEQLLVGRRDAADDMNAVGGPPSDADPAAGPELPVDPRPQVVDVDVGWMNTGLIAHEIRVGGAVGRYEQRIDRQPAVHGGVVAQWGSAAGQSTDRRARV